MRVNAPRLPPRGFFDGGSDGPNIVFAVRLHSYRRGSPTECFVRTREILFIFVVFSCAKSRIGLHSDELLSTIAKKLELTQTRARFGASDALFFSAGI